MTTIGESKTIELMKPLGPPTRQLKRVTLRAPQLSDFIEFGEVEILVPVADGKGFIEINMDAVSRYVNRLVDKDTDLAVLEGACLEDSMLLRDAVLSFFRDARLRIAARNTLGSASPEPSASDTASQSAA